MTWDARIQAARESGQFGESDRDLAHNWDSNPAGERVAEFDVSEIPLDFRELGAAFIQAVDEDQIAVAASLLSQIGDLQICRQCGVTFNYHNGGYCAGCTG